MVTEDGAVSVSSRLSVALGQMDETAYLRLYAKAKNELWGTFYSDPHELFNEAIRRTLDGSRTWPIHVPFPVFIANAMRSTADGIRQLAQQSTEIAACDLRNEADDDVDDDPIESYGSDELAPDLLMQSEQAGRRAATDLKMIYEHFKDDAEVTMILMGAADEYSPEQIRETGEMTLVQYETARKRLRRGLARLFPSKKSDGVDHDKKSK